MNHSDHCAALEVEVDRFVTTVRAANLECAVPSCPGWDLAALIRHQGMVHRFAEWHVRHLAAARTSPAEIGIEIPADSELVSWLAEGGAALCATLRGADPAAPMWAWGADRHVRFWSRRQLHETAVHRADAELTLGREPVIDAPVAIDAIDELLANIWHAGYFAPNTTKLIGTGESLHLHCTDADGEWMIVLEPKGFRWEHAHGKGTVAVRGTATDLLLLASNRRVRTDNRFEVFGDADLLDFWLENSAL